MLKSKIVWTQLAGFAASVLAAWGLDVGPERLVEIVIGVQAAQGFITAVWRKWFTTRLL